MILGIGTDIVSIARVMAAYARHGERFALRILAVAEQADYQQSQDKPRFLAKRFAVKEAVAKALRTGFRQGVSWQDIALSHDALRAPSVLLSGRAAEVFAAMNGRQCHISLSDEQDTVLVFVVLED